MQSNFQHCSEANTLCLFSIYVQALFGFQLTNSTSRLLVDHSIIGPKHWTFWYPTITIVFTILHHVVWEVLHWQWRKLHYSSRLFWVECLKSIFCQADDLCWVHTKLEQSCYSLYYLREKFVILESDATWYIFATFAEDEIVALLGSFGTATSDKQVWLL